MKFLENTKEKSKKVSHWVKEHKVELSIGIFILVGLGIVIGLKCKKQIRVPISATPYVPNIEPTIPIDINVVDEFFRTSSSPKAAHCRKLHLRNLVNKNASVEKIKQAADLGIQLSIHQTIVSETCINAN